MAQPTCEQLLELLARKDRRIGELEAQLRTQEVRIRELEGQVSRLTGLLEEATRARKRQAAPFSRGEPRPAPRPPGRKPGPDYGTPAFRSAPPPRKIDETHEAALPARCPACGGGVRETRIDHQYQVEIPRRPIYRKFNVHIGVCACCQRRVQGRHALQTSDALGAAASQLGPDLQALIVQLNKDAGLSHGKIQRLVKALFDVELSRGGVAQAMLRVGRRCAPIWQAIMRALPRQAWIVPDETGWRIGGRPAWLHAFAAGRITGYVIDRKRGGGVAEGVLGFRYAGAMIHDGWAPYDRFWRAVHQQCLAHLLRRCAEMIASAAGGAARFPGQVKKLLRDALRLRDRHRAGEVGDHGLAVSRGRLETRLDRLLRWTRANPANERFARHLDKHRHQLFTFLRHPGLDATNWRGEQALRPAVVNRKVWGGNRTWLGAQVQSILTSLAVTLTQRSQNLLTWFAQARRALTPLPLPKAGR